MASSVRSQSKMSEETFNFLCTACAEDNMTVEAVKYCVQCSGYCCQPCVDAHKKFPTLKKHNLLEVSQANQASGQQSGLTEFPTERCSKHAGKVLDMFCKGHNSVGCYVCIATDHKSCQGSQINSIPDMIDTLFKLSDCKQTSALLKDMMVTIETESKSNTSQLQTLHKSKTNSLDKVNTYEKALHAILTKKAEASRQEIENVYKQLAAVINNKQQATDNIHGDLKTTDDKLNDADGNRAQQFVCAKIGQEKIKEAEDVMKSSPGLQDHAGVTFIPDQSIMDCMRGLQGIGQVQKHEQQKDKTNNQQKPEQQSGTVNNQQKPGQQAGAVNNQQKPGQQSGAVNNQQKPGQQSGAVNNQQKPGQQSGTVNNQQKPGQQSGTVNNQQKPGQQSGTVRNQQQPGQQSGAVYKKQKDNLYKIKARRDINTKLTGDTSTCNSWGCCLTPDNQLLVTDALNKKLKRIDIQTLSVVDYCTLDSSPRGICCISKDEVAVACMRDNKIQFVSIQGKMFPIRQIKMSHDCYGIAFNDDKLYVTDNGSSLYMYDMTGTLLKTVTRDNAGNQLFNHSRHVTFNVSGNRMYVGRWDSGVVCFDGMGNYLSTMTDTDLKRADGICVDGKDNMFVVGCWSHNVVQFNENGKKVGVVVKNGDGLHTPYSVCFHQGLNRMFVTMCGSDMVKMYKLE